MKLAVVRPFEALSLPGVRATGTMTIVPGKEGFRDWFAHVRGPSVFLVSPPGFMQDDPKSQARRVYEVPRSHCHLGWDVDDGDTLQSLVNWSPTCASCDHPLAITEGPHCAACAAKKREREAKAAAAPILMHNEPEHGDEQGYMPSSDAPVPDAAAPPTDPEPEDPYVQKAMQKLSGGKKR